MNTTRLWWLSLGLGAVVVAVVAGLLQRIIVAAQSIDSHANDIWIAGKQIAGNTVSIWMLEQTNNRLGEIADASRSIDRTVAAMDENLRSLVSANGERS